MLLIQSDLIEATEDIKNGEKIFQKINGTIVTIFGGARVEECSDLYKTAMSVASGLANKGCNILTGGGPGIMEAGNRGAIVCKDNIASIGFNIELPKEQKENIYLTEQYKFKKMYIRKSMLINYSAIFVIFPGGFGTMDELFELLTLVQNKKISPRKIFLYDSTFYNPMIQFLENSLLRYNMIIAEDLKLFQVVDNIDEILSQCDCTEKI